MNTPSIPKYNPDRLGSMIADEFLIGPPSGFANTKEVLETIVALTNHCEWFMFLLSEATRVIGDTDPNLTDMIGVAVARYFDEFDGD